MPPTINEPEVDYNAQVQEIKRLIASTSDEEKAALLEEQLKELELESHQATKERPIGFQPQRRKSFRPMSAKPLLTLSTLTEESDQPSPSSSPPPLSAFTSRPSKTLTKQGDIVAAAAAAAEATRKFLAHDIADNNSLILEVFSSSYDLQYAPYHITDAHKRSFWISSGMFPQLLMIKLKNSFRIENIELICRHVHKIHVRATPERGKGAPIHVTKIVPFTDHDTLSTIRFNLMQSADEEDNILPIASIDIDIESGHQDFCIVYFARIKESEKKTNNDNDSRVKV